MNHTNGGADTQAPGAKLLTPRDLQRELRIGERLCYKLLRSQAIPNVKVGHLYRIKRSDLDEVLEQGAVLESRQ